jgi:hypothetical protein
MDTVNLTNASLEHNPHPGSARSLPEEIGLAHAASVELAFSAPESVHGVVV